MDITVHATSISVAYTSNCEILFYNTQHENHTKTCVDSMDQLRVLLDDVDTVDIKQYNVTRTVIYDVPEGGQGRLIYEPKPLLPTLPLLTEIVDRCCAGVSRVNVSSSDGTQDLASYIHLFTGLLELSINARGTVSTLPCIRAVMDALLKAEPQPSMLEDLTIQDTIHYSRQAKGHIHAISQHISNLPNLKHLGCHARLHPQTNLEEGMVAINPNESMECIRLRFDGVFTTEKIMRIHVERHVVCTPNLRSIILFHGGPGFFVDQVSKDAQLRLMRMVLKHCPKLKKFKLGHDGEPETTGVSEGFELALATIAFLHGASCVRSTISHIPFEIINLIARCLL